MYGYSCLPVSEKKLTYQWGDCNTEFNNLNSLPNLLKVIKPITWTEFLACIKKQYLHTKLWLKSLKGRDHPED
jgi:hypothetical protein